MGRRIPGVDAPPSGGLAVLLPMRARGAGHPDDLAFSRWLGSASSSRLLLVVALAAAWPLVAEAQGRYSMGQALDALWRWLPFLVTKGFALNILITGFLLMNRREWTVCIHTSLSVSGAERRRL